MSTGFHAGGSGPTYSWGLTPGVEERASVAKPYIFSEATELVDASHDGTLVADAPCCKAIHAMPYGV